MDISKVSPKAPAASGEAAPKASEKQKKAQGTSTADAFQQVARERAQRTGATGPDGSAGQAGANAATRGGRGFAGRRVSAEAEVITETNPQATVWAHEGFVRSQGKTIEAPVVGEVQLSKAGIRVQLLHVSGEALITTLQGNAPFANGSKSPTDAFIQSQTVQTLNAYLERLAGFGLDLKSVYHDNVANDGVIRVFVNAMDILNAAYVPGRNIYFFGNFKKSFPLASDKDTIVHECSHGLVDHIAPAINGGAVEGAAFHEAFGDIMATLMFRNAGVGEDLGTFLAKQGEAPKQFENGIRRVDNNEILSDEVTEEHDRSLPYSGLMWSTYQVLAKAVGEEKAADVMMGAYVKALFFITGRDPSSSDIIEALAEGVRSYLGSVMPDKVADVTRALLSEAKRRNMTSAPLTEKLTPKDVPCASAADVLKIVTSQPEVAARKDVKWEVMRDAVFNDVRKVTVRPVLVGGNAQLPVEDSSLTVVMEGGKAKILDTATFGLPPKFDFGSGLPDLADGVEAAREIIRQQLAAAAAENEGAAKIFESFDTIFDPKNMESEWVISRGEVCVSLRTLAGDFVVDVKNRDVWPRSPMRVEGKYLRLEKTTL